MLQRELRAADRAASRRYHHPDRSFVPVPNRPRRWATGSTRTNAWTLSSNEAVVTRSRVSTAATRAAGTRRPGDGWQGLRDAGPARCYRRKALTSAVRASTSTEPARMVSTPDSFPVARRGSSSSPAYPKVTHRTGHPGVHQRRPDLVEYPSHQSPDVPRWRRGGEGMHPSLPPDTLSFGRIPDDLTPRMPCASRRQQSTKGPAMAGSIVPSYYWPGAIVTTWLLTSRN